MIQVLRWGKIVYVKWKIPTHTAKFRILATVGNNYYLQSEKKRSKFQPFLISD